ncbi:hypothetical protein VCRA2121O391_480003 [Vibrio crassostreae]|nr:hypothetical protein VCRA2118O239_110152 [Vibrio crassostreae]CAK1738700.1 hypothetical protein VCRA2110O173_130015 [Vibrio crassostreae]CAK2000905.1 hypothetical protein VCRA2113O207_320007 [Vibrio crassostreae]CAK2014319.1 hypothetical protein VCRA2113O356_300014 [Vibrio crassostreae]CAK2134941.1 hypothetical protein VCRA2117O378_480010 [Vibrio crassostreae]
MNELRIKGGKWKDLKLMRHGDNSLISFLSGLIYPEYNN